MKNFIKLLGIVTLVVTIGFSMAACNNGDNGDNGNSSNSGNSGNGNSSGNGLTITGLGDYNGKYAVAVGRIYEETETREVLIAAVSIDMKKKIITSGKISGGSVTLKVWKIEADDKVSSYSGNDTVKLTVSINNKALLTGDEKDFAGGKMYVTFKNGVASVSVAAGDIMPIYSGENENEDDEN